MSDGLTTPVAFILFNRPDVTRRAFECIRAARPAKLFLIGDGARADRPGEAEQVAAARAVVKSVDWPCEVQRSFLDTNVGCGVRISTGVSWVFEHVEEAIFLEDDCLPHPDFFPYCRQLLERYRDDERVMHVHGNNFQGGARRGPYSYFFSKHPHCWGWATWRRAWKHFDLGMKSWPQAKTDGVLRSSCDSEDELAYWSNLFEARYQVGTPPTWNASWVYACWVQSGLCVYPNVNLVSNVGFGADAMNCQRKNPFAELPVQAIGDLRHPPHMVRDREADAFTNRNVFLRYVKQKI